MRKIGIMILVVTMCITACGKAEASKEKTTEKGTVETEAIATTEENEGVPHVFAYNEEEIPGVDVNIREVSNTGITLEINNNIDHELFAGQAEEKCEEDPEECDLNMSIWWGEQFELERYNNETKIWEPVPTLCEPCFNEIAYEMGRNKIGEWKTDWEWLYGKLECGKYRIIKEIGYRTLLSSGPAPMRYYMTEFEVR